VTQAPQNTESTFLQLRWYHDKWDWVIATKDNIRCFFRGCSQLLYHWAMDPTLVDPCVYRLLNIMLMAGLHLDYCLICSVISHKAQIFSELISSNFTGWGHVYIW
jgi:hypothetical protein